MREVLDLTNAVAAELAGLGDGVLETLRDRLDCTIRLRGNQLTLEGDDDDVAEARSVIDELVELVEGGHDVGSQTVDAEHGVDRLRADLVAALDQLDELVDHRARLGDVVVVALQRQLVAPEPDRAVEPVAQGLEHPVPEPGQLGRDGVREIENFLHAHQCRSQHIWHASGADTSHLLV